MKILIHVHESKPSLYGEYYALNYLTNVTSIAG